MQKPKQKRSLVRTNKILDTAELILNEENLKALTIARISQDAQLKRTSTYKFFETHSHKNAVCCFEQRTSQTFQSISTERTTGLERFVERSHLKSVALRPKSLIFGSKLQFCVFSCI